MNETHCCTHCGQPLVTFEQFRKIYATCANPGCRKYKINALLERLQVMPEAEIQEYQAVQESYRALFPEGAGDE